MTTTFKRSFSSWRWKTAQTNRIFISQTWHVNNEVIEWLVVIMNKEFCAWHFINSRYLVEVIRLLPINCIRLSKLYPNRTIQPRKRHRSHHNHVKNAISNLIAVLGISHRQWSIPLTREKIGEDQQEKTVKIGNLGNCKMVRQLPALLTLFILLKLLYTAKMLTCMPLY